MFVSIHSATVDACSRVAESVYRRRGGRIKGEGFENGGDVVVVYICVFFRRMTSYSVVCCSLEYPWTSA